MADGYYDAKDKVLEDITTKGLEPNVVTWWVNCPIRMRLIPTGSPTTLDVRAGKADRGSGGSIYRTGGPTTRWVRTVMLH